MTKKSKSQKWDPLKSTKICLKKESAVRGNNFDNARTKKIREDFSKLRDRI